MKAMQLTDPRNNADKRNQDEEEKINSIENY